MLYLSNTSFELIENKAGHAAGRTVMRFDASSDPYRATYTGPNIRFGQALVQGDEMLYHAVESDGRMTAGRARVSVENGEMRLAWQWLTGEQTSGISIWRQLEP